MALESNVAGRLRCEGDKHGSVYASESDQESDAAYEGLRRMFEDGRHVGSFATVSRVRSRWVLRFIEEQARYETLSSNEAPDHEVVRARRELGLVLHRRSGVGFGLGRAVRLRSART